MQVHDRCRAGVGRCRTGVGRVWPCAGQDRLRAGVGRCRTGAGLVWADMIPMDTHQTHELSKVECDGDLDWFRYIRYRSAEATVVSQEILNQLVLHSVYVLTLFKHI